MTSAPVRPAERPRIAAPAEALALVNSLLATLAELQAVITSETALMRDGRVADALALEESKSALAGQYMRGLETMKANAVALARLVPAEIGRLKTAHAAFSTALGANQTVLATARAVSETILRDLAREAGRSAQPQGYRAGGQAVPAGGARPSAVPLMVSKSL